MKMKKNYLARQILWGFILELPTFSIPLLKERCKRYNCEVSDDTIQRYTRFLRKEGYIEVIPREKSRAHIYRVKQCPGIHAPILQKGKAYDPNTEKLDSVNRMWVSMRILRSFDLSQLAMCAEVSLSLASNYIAYLKQAGFIRAEGLKGRGHKSTYFLIRNAGPLAPCLLRSQGVVVQIFDLNTKTFYNIQKKSHKKRTAA